MHGLGYIAAVIGAARLKTGGSRHLRDFGLDVWGECIRHAATQRYRVLDCISTASANYKVQSPPVATVVPLQADYYNNALRSVNLASGLVRTVAGSPSSAWGYADGVGTAALLNSPSDVAVDGAGTFAIVVRLY